MIIIRRHSGNITIDSVDISKGINKDNKEIL